MARCLPFLPRSLGIPYHKREFEHVDYEDGTTGYIENAWEKRSKHAYPRIIHIPVDEDVLQNRIPSLLSLAQDECVHLLTSFTKQHRAGFCDTARKRRKEILDEEERRHFQRHVSAMFRALRGERPGDVFLQWRMYRGIMPDFIRDLELSMKQQPPKYLRAHEVRSNCCDREEHNSYPLYTPTKPV